MLTDSDIKAEAKRIERAGLLVDIQRHWDGPGDNAAPSRSVKATLATVDASGRCFRVDLDFGPADTRKTLGEALAGAVATLDGCLRGDYSVSGVRVSFDRLCDVVCYHGAGWRSVVRAA